MALDFVHARNGTWYYLGEAWLMDQKLVSKNEATPAVGDTWPSNPFGSSISIQPQ